MICGDHVPSPSSVSSPVRSLATASSSMVLIEFVADFLDMARLLLAEQIAGAADVEIVACQRKAGAQRIERLQHLEPLLRRWRQRAVGGRREQRIGALLGSADAAAQLIELRQTEHVGAMDDQRIGGRDIETRFDDGRRQQHVEFAGHRIRS